MGKVFFVSIKKRYFIEGKEDILRAEYTMMGTGGIQGAYQEQRDQHFDQNGVFLLGRHEW